MTQDFCDSVTDAQKKLHGDMRRTEWSDPVPDPVKRRNAVWYSVAIAVVIVGAISIWRGMK